VGGIAHYHISTLANRSVTEIPQVENHALAWAG